MAIAVKSRANLNSGSVTALRNLLMILIAPLL